MTPPLREERSLLIIEWLLSRISLLNIYQIARFLQLQGIENFETDLVC